MFKPAMVQLVKDSESYYAFVVAIARRAREIATDADEQNDVLDEKPVNQAMDEFASGKIKVEDYVLMREE